MTLWRISNHATLDGGGGLRASGRWHARGRRVIYCASSPAGALLEVPVHAEIEFEDLPVGFRFMEIAAPEATSVETLDPAVFGPGWRTDMEATRRAGDDWLASLRTALFRVPCVIAPATWNVLINPRHPESARIRVIRIHDHPIDPRLPR